MTTSVELTRFRVVPEKVEALLAARPAMVADFEADREGFLGARLVRLPGDEWLDIVEWRSSEDYAVSSRKGPNRPGIKAFFDAIDSLVTAEEGELSA
ncbi:antibiotic biosynthesis monooxygenase [Lentzea sp. NBC_00516]|uniref:antibiotic biosynthesis monooxygenase n=1 Tax=Lentzea sp. NBC_00516 TaxID=2903582 RepID=UPI002E8004AE|nr:antibiotic biosynthesis monooxygenase [Lentzea sp. NBC_00516]WUD29191.1 antibiotic biosynthesis monooxygenase [Lentzea sp. NBC_00516]